MSIKTDKIKDFYRKNQEKIKTVALPILVFLAVFFFWIYGNDKEEISIESPKQMEEEDLQPTDSLSTIDNFIYVDIAGEVNVPGVYKIPDGTRLFQVIEEAGGFTENAYMDEINQAEAVYDGQKIIIHSKFDQSNENNMLPSNSNAASGIKGVRSDGKVNINTADALGLQTIPGIGPSKADRILTYRQNNGNFRTIEDIKNVSGIGDQTFESIKEYLSVT